MDYVKKLFTERTSWDGWMLIGVGVAVIILGPLAKWAAFAAIAYGAWTLFKGENNE